MPSSGRRPIPRPRRAGPECRSSWRWCCRRSATARARSASTSRESAVASAASRSRIRRGLAGRGRVFPLVPGRQTCASRFAVRARSEPADAHDGLACDRGAGLGRARSSAPGSPSSANSAATRSRRHSGCSRTNCANCAFVTGVRSRRKLGDGDLLHARRRRQHRLERAAGDRRHRSSAQRPRQACARAAHAEQRECSQHRCDAHRIARVSAPRLPAASSWRALPRPASR